MQHSARANAQPFVDQWCRNQRIEPAPKALVVSVAMVEEDPGYNVMEHAVATCMFTVDGVNLTAKVNDGPLPRYSVGGVFYGHHEIHDLAQLGGILERERADARAVDAARAKRRRGRVRGWAALAVLVVLAAAAWTAWQRAHRVQAAPGEITGLYGTVQDARIVELAWQPTPWATGGYDVIADGFGAEGLKIVAAPNKPAARIKLDMSRGRMISVRARHAGPDGGPVGPDTTILCYEEGPCRPLPYRR
ncbi:hypothetical protein [Pedococcus sp. 2YAF34]|uniref:hypothetical protein n=1 Tax=Pedococcus sp. 2YAF34 TaxID=3233032 RepID=UPI003F9C3765